MPKISIVTPVYKVENYLSFCIESILSQTYQDFELILVDDGSPDNAGVICDYYAKRDKRVKVIHKSNGGVSAARLDGVRIAQGEWIMFVDSDDAISNSCLKQLIHYESTDASIIEGSCILFKNNEEIQKREEKDASAILYEANAIEYANGIMQYVPNMFFSTPWLKIIRSRLLKETDALLLPSDITNGEDQIMCLRIGANKNFTKAIKTDCIIYYYRQRGDSATSNVRDEAYNKKLVFYVSESTSRYGDREWHRKVYARFCYETMLTLIKKKQISSRWYWVRRSFCAYNSLRTNLNIIMVLVLPINVLHQFIRKQQ